MSITRIFRCVACNEYFETFSPNKDGIVTVCECGGELLQQYGNVTVFVKNEPKSLGLLAKRNSDAMGPQELKDRVEQDKQRRIETRQRAREELQQKLPAGASLPEIDSGYRPWWRTNREKPLTQLNRLTVEQKNKYILDGKLPPGTSL